MAVGAHPAEFQPYWGQHLVLKCLHPLLFVMKQARWHQELPCLAGRAAAAVLLVCRPSATCCCSAILVCCPSVT